jgi:hypothetical protein
VERCSGTLAESGASKPIVQARLVLIGDLVFPLSGNVAVVALLARRGDQWENMALVRIEAEDEAVAPVRSGRRESG